MEHTLRESDDFAVVDDGTMDTVVQCGACGAEVRYTHQPGPDGDCDETYEEFVAWALADARDSHECDNTESE